MPQIGNLIRRRFRRRDKTTGTAVAVQFDLHDIPRWLVAEHLDGNKPKQSRCHRSETSSDDASGGATKRQAQQSQYNSICMTYLAGWLRNISTETNQSNRDATDRKPHPTTLPAARQNDRHSSRSTIRFA